MLIRQQLPTQVFFDRDEEGLLRQIRFGEKMRRVLLVGDQRRAQHQLMQFRIRIRLTFPSLRAQRPARVRGLVIQHHIRIHLSIHHI